MLHEIQALYNEPNPARIPEQKLTDMIHFLQQMLEGGHLKDIHLAKIQQLGLLALQSPA
jgi:hypothetical protein